VALVKVGIAAAIPGFYLSVKVANYLQCLVVHIRRPEGRHFHYSEKLFRRKLSGKLAVGVAYLA
jgi:hypothetical protein